MTDKDLGQLFMIGLSGLTLTPVERKFIIDNNIGGVTFFNRNISNPEQVYNLCAELRSLTDQLPNRDPLYIAVDMEGGRVARLKAPFTLWPPAKKLGELNSTTVSFDFGQALGTELRAVGFNVDWAPCADILTNPTNPAIGDRAYATDAETTGKHCSAVVRGLLKSGIQPCVKHFPGHGNTVVDSHFVLPKDDTSLSQMRERELLPFRKAFRARAEMLMTCHILFPDADPKYPATLSEFWLQKILRTELGYDGLIISDDLGMKAMADNYGAEEIPLLALAAGVNILLYCNEPDVPPIAQASLRRALALPGHETLKKGVEDSVRRVRENKKQFLANFQPPTWAEAQKIIGAQAHRDLAKTIFGG